MTRRTMLRTALIALTLFLGAALVTGCGTQNGNTRDMKALAMEHAQAMKVLNETRGIDTHSIERFYAEDAVFEDVPMKERVEGRDEIMAHFRENVGSLPNTDTVEYILTGDDWFAVQDRLVTDYFDDITFFTVCEVENGLITHHWETYASDLPWVKR